MNKKLITGSLTLGIVYAFVFASAASAFWPFDVLFKKSGDVKAETTEKKMMVADVGPGGSRAEMTYRTLVSLNDTCRRLLSVETPQPTRPRITPSARDTITSDSDGRKMAAKKADDMYVLEFGIESKNEKELTAIYNNLKARCENIANLTTRMRKIYKGNANATPSPIKVVSVTSSPKMKCDINSRVSNYGCPENMACIGGYCQPGVELSTVDQEQSADMSCGGIAGKICPEGYTCSYRNGNDIRGKVSPDAMGTCVRSDLRKY